MPYKESFMDLITGINGRAGAWEACRLGRERSLTGQQVAGQLRANSHSLL
jgi:hypothetical protein